MQPEEIHRKILFTFDGQKNEIGGACGTYGGQEGWFWLEDPREGDQLEDLIGDRIILKMSCAKIGMRRRGLDW